ncbi:MAG TPA: DUF4331 domain-containing protein [Actinomycetota bacterium]|nr:DUF4331 domain-containing protein [Actinomycetota bacterium]
MHRNIRKRVVAGAASLTLGVGLFAGLAPTGVIASSHREAPLTSADPQIDNTDVYAFVSPDKPNTVSLISSWIPFEEPAGGPNFYQWAEDTNYDINIDNDGDARPDVTYRWRFKTKYRNPNSFIYNNGAVTSLNDPNLLVRQTYDLYRIKGGTSKRVLDNARVAPSHVGDASMPNYNADLFDAAVTTTGKTSSWVGQSDDPFFLDLRVFDLLYGGDFSEVGDDTLKGFNVNTFAIQVPKGALRTRGESVIGVWSTASRGSLRVQTNTGTSNYRGNNVQVSRLGMPLVNEVVVPVGVKDYFNASKPKNDGQYLPAVNDPELPRLISAVYPAVFPDVPDSNDQKNGVQRKDLKQVFLTGVPGLNKPAGVQASEMLRLNLDIAPCTSGCSRLGVLGGDTAGFPNGRRLYDDVVDIALRVVMGALLPNHDADADTLGDGVNTNDLPFQNVFPYVAYPTSGSDPNPH